MPLTRSLLLLLAVATMARAEDWPQWLGPRRDGSSAEKVVPWSGALKVAWKQAVGEGHSSPVVAGDVVYLHHWAKGSTEETVGAFSAKDGSPLWSVKYDRGNAKFPFGGGPRATPSVVDGKVYTFGISGLLSSFDAKTGAKDWQIDTLKELNAKNLFFGASCSPLVYGDKIFVNIGGKGASLVAFDWKSGQVIWKALDDKASYSSPIATGKGDDRRVIFLTAAELVAVAAKDGTVLWKYPLVDKLFESSTTPVIAGDMLFGSSITFGGLGLKMAGGKVSEAWMNEKLNCYFSTPVAVGSEHLYMVTGTKPSLAALIPGGKKMPNKADLHCVEASTGKILWTREKVGQYHASLLRTGDGKLLLVEEAGDLVLLDPNPKEYRELARSKICGNTWAHPAVANGHLYIRDNTSLICVKLSQ